MIARNLMLFAASTGLLVGCSSDGRNRAGVGGEATGGELETSASATHVSSGFEALPEVGEVGFETALDYVFASAFLLVLVLRPTGGR